MTIVVCTYLFFVLHHVKGLKLASGTLRPCVTSNMWPRYTYVCTLAIWSCFTLSIWLRLLAGKEHHPNVKRRPSFLQVM
jgi:hypothetical protein